MSWTTSSCTPYVGCQPTTRHKLGTATAKLHPREDPGRPAGRRGQGNHGGSPNVIDDDILIFARALKDQGTPIPQIATKLTITTVRTPAGPRKRRRTGEGCCTELGGQRTRLRIRPAGLYQWLHLLPPRHATTGDRRPQR